MAESQGIYALADSQTVEPNPREEAQIKMATEFQSTLNAGIREYMAAMLQRVHIANHNGANLGYVDKVAVGRKRGLSEMQLANITPFPSPPTINLIQNQPEVTERERALERRVVDLEGRLRKAESDNPDGAGGGASQVGATAPPPETKKGTWAKVWPYLLTAGSALGGGVVAGHALAPKPIEPTTGEVELEVEGWQTPLTREPAEEPTPASKVSASET